MFYLYEVIPLRKMLKRVVVKCNGIAGYINSYWVEYLLYFSSIITVNARFSTNSRVIRKRTALQEVLYLYPMAHTFFPSYMRPSHFWLLLAWFGTSVPIIMNICGIHRYWKIRRHYILIWISLNNNYLLTERTCGVVMKVVTFSRSTV